MDLGNDEIREITKQIQAERDSSRLIALVEQLVRLLDEPPASTRSRSLTGQANETQRAD
jgi:hypothetical protein